MSLLGSVKRQPEPRLGTWCSLLTDKQLVDKAITLGREYEFERHLLLFKDRLKLEQAKAELLFRLRNKNRTGG